MIPKNIEMYWQNMTFLFKEGKMDNVLKEIKNNKRNICPEVHNIFRAFSLSPDEIKVVIVGLAPYNHMAQGKKVASGLAFGTPDDTIDTPSLKVIRKCIKTDLEEYSVNERFDNTLQHWWEQGIMLYNASLTVTLGGDPRQHLELWREFTTTFVEQLSQQKEDIVWLFLGKDASEFSKFVKNQDLVIIAPHPAATARAGYDSPLNVNLIKHNVFKRIDTILETMNKKIEWLKIPF